MGFFCTFSIFSYWSTFIGGELRQASTIKTANNMAIAAVAGPLVVVVCAAIFFHTFGTSFMIAANGGGTVPIAPQYFSLIAASTGNTIIAIVLFGGYILFWPLICYISFIQPTRMLFAYAFDGILPKAVTNLSANGSPYVAVIIATLASFITLIWAVNGSSFFQVLVYATLVQLIAMALVGLSAVVVPYTKPDLYRASATKKTFAGIPVVSIAGAGAFLTCVFVWVLYFHYPTQFFLVGQAEDVHHLRRDDRTGHPVLLRREGVQEEPGRRDRPGVRRDPARVTAMQAQGAGSARPPVAVVTGAAMGIGRAVAERLVGDSIQVVGLDRDETALAAAAEAIGERFRPVVGDVGEWADHERAADAAAELGTLRHWVNNAGIDWSDPAHEVTAAHIQEGLRVLQLGPMYGGAVAVRRMLRTGGGSIVNVSSIQGAASFPATTSTGRPRRRVLLATKSIAVDYGPFGIRCNAVLPGVIETPMTHALLPPDLSREEAMRQEGLLAPMLRAGQPSEMADVIAFLLSDRASYVNGAEIVADGGAMARCYAYPPLDIEGAT